MDRTADKKALYMHCLPADITDVSCKAGEVSAEVFEQYRIPTYHEASYKPFVISALMFLARLKDPGAKLEHDHPPRPEPPPLADQGETHVQDRQVLQRRSASSARPSAARTRGIVIPTFAQMRHPETAPDAVKAKLKGVGLWDVDPANLFRITWKNDPETGLFGGPNHLEIPRAITGVKARIIGLVGKYFPTGAHKVGAAFALPGAPPGERRVRPRRRTRPSGPPPATTAAAAPSTAPSWAARPWPSCPRT